MTGNEAANLLNGRSGIDTLFGGAGADTLDGGIDGDLMAGGAGDDVYIVDSIADLVWEEVGAGNDLVQSAVTFTLADNVEALTLTGTSGIFGTGNVMRTS